MPIDIITKFGIYVAIYPTKTGHISTYAILLPKSKKEQLYTYVIRVFPGYLTVDHSLSHTIYFFNLFAALHSHNCCRTKFHVQHATCLLAARWLGWFFWCCCMQLFVDFSVCLFVCFCVFLALLVAALFLLLLFLLLLLFFLRLLLLLLLFQAVHSRFNYCQPNGRLHV